MGYVVRYRDKELTEAAGFPAVAHLPFLFHAQSGYHDLGSEYIIDRGTSVWVPSNEGTGFDPTTVSIQNYAKRLCNFLDYCEARGVDTLTCTYSEHLLGMYQPDMLKGHWSEKNQPLQAATINVRVHTACDYLRWLTAKGYRKTAFNVLTRTTKVRVEGRWGNGGHTTREVQRRIGQLRVKKSMLVMPTATQVRRWLKSVKANSGPTFELMCESVCLFAPRESELVGLRVADIVDADRKLTI